MISKYNEFLFENSIDSISESIVYLSPNLRKVLKKINSDISKDFLGIEGKDIKDDVTFIDIDKQDGYFSFTTMKNAIKYIKTNLGGEESSYVSIENTPRVSLSDNFYVLPDEKSMWKTGRNPLRIGRMINKLLPGKYSDKEREQFTNIFKATLDKVGERFILVSGKDIPKWYSDKNYFSMEHTLGSSCMRSKSDDIFQIYSENPEVCQMLCLIEENDAGVEKLKARALVWKVSDFGWWSEDPSKELPKFEYFMDRQYAISDALIEKMKLYAKGQSWAFKTHNNHHSYQQVTLNDVDMSVLMRVALKKQKYTGYPYMDTFRRYIPDSATLFSDDSEDNSGDYILEDTTGGHREVGNEEYYSEYYDTHLSEDDAVWSEPLNDYLPVRRAVNITHGSRRNQGWYPEDYDDIVYDEWSDISLHIDDAIYCERNGMFIFEEDAVSVVEVVYDDGSCNSDDSFYHKRDKDIITFGGNMSESVWYKNIIKKADYWDIHSGILKSLLTKDWSNEWILTKFEIGTYKVNDETYMMDYMTDIDAELLEIDIDKSNSRIEEAWGYTERLKDSNLIPQLKFAIKSKIKQDQLSFDFGSEFDNPVKDRISNYEKRLKQLDMFLV